MALSLNTSLLLSEQIALGNYNKINSLIDPGRFCFYFEDADQGLVNFEWKLFPYEGEEQMSEVEIKMAREGFVSANLEFGLAFGAQELLERHKATVIFLDAHAWVSQGDCIFVCLRGTELGVIWTYPNGDLNLAGKEENPQFLGIKRII
jgi:hypothetical protein